MIASTLISPGGRFKAIRRKLKYFPIIESSYLLHFHAYTQLPCSYLTPCFNLILASQNALNLIPSCLFYDFPIANTLSPLPPFSLFTTSLTSSYKNTEISPIKKKKKSFLDFVVAKIYGFRVQFDVLYSLLTLRCARTCPVMH